MSWIVHDNYMLHPETGAYYVCVNNCITYYPPEWKKFDDIDVYSRKDPAICKEIWEDLYNTLTRQSLAPMRQAKTLEVISTRLERITGMLEMLSAMVSAVADSLEKK